jgi:hypothetical protein
MSAPRVSENTVTHTGLRVSCHSESSQRFTSDSAVQKRSAALSSPVIRGCQPPAGAAGMPIESRCGSGCRRGVQLPLGICRPSAGTLGSPQRQLRARRPSALARPALYRSIWRLRRERLPEQTCFLCRPRRRPPFGTRCTGRLPGAPRIYGLTARRRRGGALGCQCLQNSAARSGSCSSCRRKSSLNQSWGSLS